MCFTNKVVLITGASSGIGAACALRFAKSCASLSLVGRNVDNLTNISNQCKNLNKHQPLLIIADVTLEDDVNRIVHETINRYKRIDILINNAGVSSITGVNVEMEAYDRIMATNVRGTYLLTRKVIPYLKDTKGNIVNISSMLSNKPLPILTPYCMSKAAIDMFTKCLAVELGPEAVRVNAVNPGPVKTEIFKRSGMSEEDYLKMLTVVEMTAPLKRIATVEDVAELVIFLASDKASCITGCCYVIDCGIGLGDAGK